MPARRLLRSSLLALLTLGLLVPLAAPPADAGRRRLEVAPDPGALGPWDVGRTSFTLIDPTRNDRSLAIDVWYPVDPEDATGPLSSYDLVFTGLPSEVALDSPEVSSAAPFPMVVFSHGSGGIRFQSFFLTETLASHGFVVVAPDHAGNTALDLLFPAPPFTTTDRPRDITFLIDEMLARNADATSGFFGRIDPERIGMTGHSFGGFTTIAMGAGFEDVPADPRIDALAPLAPVSTSFTTAELNAIDEPTIVIGGTLDTTTPIDPQSTTAFSEIGARPRFRIDIIDADHFSFASFCKIGDALIAIGAPPNIIEQVLGSIESTCGPETIDIVTAQRITNHYVVSFMKVFVEGDVRYIRELSPGRAKTEPVDYFRQLGGGKD
ncbi:MAG: dienelactone hydrolase family protein [Myxococcota bacterium]|nr:dienelactone hydrolase family protein [Myxococcota bacterium]